MIYDLLDIDPYTHKYAFQNGDVWLLIFATYSVDFDFSLASYHRVGKERHYTKRTVWISMVWSTAQTHCWGKVDKTLNNQIYSHVWTAVILLGRCAESLCFSEQEAGECQQGTPGQLIDFHGITLTWTKGESLPSDIKILAEVAKKLPQFQDLKEQVTSLLSVMSSYSPQSFDRYRFTLNSQTKCLKYVAKIRTLSSMQLH